VAADRNQHAFDVSYPNSWTHHRGCFFSSQEAKEQQQRQEQQRRAEVERQRLEVEEAEQRPESVAQDDLLGDPKQK